MSDVIFVYILHCNKHEILVHDWMHASLCTVTQLAGVVH